MLAHLNYPILNEYPKGDNGKDYVLGEYLQSTIIDTKNNKVIKEETKVELPPETAQQTYLFF